MRIYGYLLLFDVMYVEKPFLSPQGMDFYHNKFNIKYCENLIILTAQSILIMEWNTAWRMIMMY